MIEIEAVVTCERCGKTSRVKQEKSIFKVETIIDCKGVGFDVERTEKSFLKFDSRKVEDSFEEVGDIGRDHNIMPFKRFKVNDLWEMKSMERDVLLCKDCQKGIVIGMKKMVELFNVNLEKLFFGESGMKESKMDDFMKYRISGYKEVSE